MRTAFLAGVLVCACACTGTALNIDHIKQAKSATVIVDLGDTRGSGTAFCIDPKGFYLTNAHVADLARDGKVKLVLNPAGGNETAMSATVLRSDAEHDIALLKTETPSAVCLALGSDENLIETMDVAAFGYPFGKALAADENSYPSITVNVGKITALRRKQGILDDIQVDALVNMGCSGGPVLGADGKVVGIIAKGILGSGVNFAIPVSKIRRFLEQPELTVTVPSSIAWTNRTASQPFTIEIAAFPGSIMPDTVQIELGTSPSRTIRAREEKPSVFSASAPIFPEATGPEAVRISLVLANATLECPALADAIKIGDRSVSLRDIARYTSTGARLTLNDGSQLPVADADSHALTIVLGKATTRISLAHVRDLTVLPPSRPAEQPYVVKALREGKILASREGAISITHDGEATLTLPSTTASSTGTRAARLPELKIPQISASEPTVKKLPSTISDVVRAGGGRYLLLSLPKIRKIAVFDVNTADIATYLPMPASEIMLAGGAEHVVVVVPGKNIIQRWSLKTMQKERTLMMPIPGVVKAIAMGAGSNGPLLVHTAKGTSALDRCNYTFLDIDSFKPVEGITCKGNPRNSSYRDLVHIRASNDGSLFGLWCTSHSPQGLESVELQGTVAVTHYDHTSVGYVVPGPRGHALFTQSGVFLPSTKRMRQAPEVMTLPSTHPVFYLGCAPPSHHKASKAEFSVYVMDSSTPIVTLPGFDEISMERVGWDKSGFSIDKRVHFVPQAEVLITIPKSNDRLVMRRFDLQAALIASDLDFLFVESIPSASAVAGRMYTYAAKVRSRAGGLSYRLDSAPEGMSVSASGILRWPVPAGQVDDVSVILTIADASGQEIFHTFDISVTD